jgi:hypothetical protein
LITGKALEDRMGVSAETTTMDVLYAILLIVTSVNLDASVRDILLDHALSLAAEARAIGCDS